MLMLRGPIKHDKKESLQTSKSQGAEIGMEIAPSSDADRDSTSWKCNACTFVNVPRIHGTDSYCKMCQTARPQSQPTGRDDALAWMEQYQESTRVLAEAEEKARIEAKRQAKRRSGKNSKQRYGTFFILNCFPCDMRFVRDFLVQVFMTT